MKTKWRGSSAAAALAVAVWGLVAAPASAVGEPATTPTITAPTDGASVSGDVQIVATSTELQVQFFEDGVAFGTPVVTSAGVAVTTWSTWGVANGGPVVWTAADCNIVGCNAVQSTPVSVNVLNDPPTITSPLDGTTTGPFPSFTATAPGGVVSFKVDDTVVGVDLTAPYTQQIAGPLPDGAHTLVVQECDAAGVQCAGPTATSNFTVLTPTLHPVIAAVTPNPFSPGVVDVRNDTTSFRVHLPDAESATWSIKNPSGLTVNGPHSAGLLAAGDHVFKWNGRSNANQIVANATFTIAVATSAASGGITLHGSATATVRVDNAAPVAHIAGGNGATFYPVVDGYLDNFGPVATVNEGGTLWLQIFTTTGTLVVQVPQAHPTAGTFRINWNGRNRANAIAAEGTFRFRFLAQDLAGNRSATTFGAVHLSHRHLVTKGITITKPGNTGALSSSDPSCTEASYSLSGFAQGVWLLNVCDPDFDGFQVIAADFTFAVPAAIRYNTVRVQTYGNTISAPEDLEAIIWNPHLGRWDPVGASPLGSDGVNLTNVYGSVAAGPMVNPQRQIRIGIGLPDAPGGTDYDLGNASIVVSYSVLS